MQLALDVQERESIVKPFVLPSVPFLCGSMLMYAGILSCVQPRLTQPIQVCASGSWRERRSSSGMVLLTQSALPSVHSVSEASCHCSPYYASMHVSEDWQFLDKEAAAAAEAASALQQHHAHPQRPRLWAVPAARVQTDVCCAHHGCCTAAAGTKSWTIQICSWALHRRS